MNIIFGEQASAQLSMLTNNYDKFFVLTDENIYRVYSSLIASLLPEKEVTKIVIPAGEESKSIENVVFIWNKLLEEKAGRDALLINLGGGTISDIGGFAASTYKRGIDFINVPTTLLAMIDASIGGKNGINFNNYKNQIGLFSEPNSVIINPNFLKTLNERDIKSGLAEMMKYATGVDLITAQVRAAVGDSVEDVEQQPYNGHWAEIILHADKDGIFSNLEIASDLPAKVIERDLWLKKGDNVTAFHGANDAIGTLVLQFTNEHDLENVLRLQAQWIKVKVI